MAKNDANPPMPAFPGGYELQEVGSDYLAKAVKPKQFLHIDQAECIMCEGCVDICPWYCIFMVRPDAVQDAGNVELARTMRDDDILFVIDDNACTRCNLCVERCPTGALVQSEVTGGKKRRGARALGSVPESQRAS